jgi:hypothetical protein
MNDEVLGLLRLQYDLENMEHSGLLNIDNELKQTQIEGATASKDCCTRLPLLLWR